MSNATICCGLPTVLDEIYPIEDGGTYPDTAGKHIEQTEKPIDANAIREGVSKWVDAQRAKGLLPKKPSES